MSRPAGSPRTVGVEEEFLVVEVDGAGLRPVGEPVAQSADERTDGQFEHELKREQAELGSAPHESLTELHDELRRRRAELARSAAEHGARIVASGCAPMPATTTTTPDRRYERMTQEFGETARDALSCGMHVHVAVSSPAEGVRALNRVRRWLPLLLALSANSPLRDGRDTGQHSYRSAVWQRWPTAGPPGNFADEADYAATCDALVATGAALDAGMLYFDARLSAHYPTLEIRVADVCPRVGDAAAIAGLARGLVEAAAAGSLPPGPAVLDRVELLRAMTWRAARYAMTGTLVHPATGRLVPAWSLLDDVLDELPLGDDRAWIGEQLGAARRDGTGSVLQLRTFERTSSPAAVVDELAELTVAP